MNITYLLIGGNLGLRENTLAEARTFIKKDVGNIRKSSSIYETAAWGITNQPDFLNQVLEVETKLSAHDVLIKILAIEKTMGRIRTRKNASRIIDIDILFFNNEIINDPGLTVPHPEVQNRKFALVPMAEIAPGLKHPLFKRTIKELLSTSGDTLEVRPAGFG
jgi:2-amino-4-hydroxy-6-hydroxymethyldihydropteridine diphosphokinase